ncbi:MAG: hypothetical protein KGL11_02275 [Alphaproteobacteria bacterium]|nr:hypothetical protein [Alphaproteobacteria bacterium]
MLMLNGIRPRAVVVGAALCALIGAASDSARAQASASVNNGCGGSLSLPVVAHGNWTGENAPTGGPADEKVVKDFQGNTWAVDSHGNVIGPATYSPKYGGGWNVTPQTGAKPWGLSMPCPPPKTIPFVPLIMQPSGSQG